MIQIQASMIVMVEFQMKIWCLKGPGQHSEWRKSLSKKAVFDDASQEMLIEINT